jgi:hypothetical protein
MKTVQLQDIVDVELILAALYAKPISGLEQLRLFDKVLSALEGIANIKYDENGNVMVFEMENGKVVFDENNRPRRAITWKSDKRELRLEDGHAEFLKARLTATEWTGAAARRALRIVEDLSKDGADH